MTLRHLFTMIVLCCILHNTSAQTTLIVSGDAWKYLDNGSNQGTTWTGTSFNDNSWSSGNSQLGYGDGDEATVVSYGADANNKYITTYFRKTISIADPSLYTNYSLSVKRDDGIIVYVNGTEVYRDGLPTGTITYTTSATTAGDDGSTWLTSTLPAGTFATGNNVIAVEIHQAGGTSSDISFDLSLVGNVAGGSGATLSRGPYLQSGTSSSVYIRWRTDIATNSKVSYGTTAGSLSSTVSDAALTTEHIIQLTGLTPNTRYYYSIGTSTQLLQGDANNTFLTAPTIGTAQKTRVWVVGDCGNNSPNQKSVTQKYSSYIGSNNTDVWLLLGDNAYSNGLDVEYQGNFFDIYPTLLKKSVLWPVPGNHDYANTAARQDDHAIPYYDMFTLPTNGEAGGVASGTEAFYSYDYANIHFVALDSYGKETNQYRLYDTLGPQLTWLKKDLTANKQKWTVVYWHHPPYTMGSHNSDTEGELISVRQNLLRILERYKVDLILCGHSHDYERSKLMKGHYGNEASFVEGTHHLSTSSAKYDGSTNSCPYTKNVTTNYDGTVYVVSGSAGSLGGSQASFPHAAMYYSDATNGGSMALTIEDNRLDAQWICADGVVRDQFTITKDVNKTTNVTITNGQSTTLTASWIGNYSWSPGGQTTRSITVSPTSNTTYSVGDGVSCLNDVFNVKVDPILGNTASSNNNSMLSLSVHPSPIVNEAHIEYNTHLSSMVKLELISSTGKVSKTLLNRTMDNGKHSYTFNAKSEGIQPGIYLLTLTCAEQTISQKIVVSNE